MARRDKKPAPRGDKAAPVTTRRDAKVSSASERRAQLANAESADAWRDTLASVVRVSIRRPNDLFVAELALHNLRVVSGASPTITRVNANEDGVIVLELPPQSFGEQAFLEATGPEVDSNSETDFEDDEFKGQAGHDNKNVATDASEAESVPALGGTKIRIAGPSRISFVMPDHVASIPYTLESLLSAARTWPARRSLSGAADPSAGNSGSPAGASAVLAGVVASLDFKSVVLNVKRTLQEMKAKAPTDRRLESVSALEERYKETVSLGKAGPTGALQFQDSTAIPALSFVSAPYAPGNKLTALELPYRLITSPIGAARWTHRTTAVPHQGRHELWHTRLTTRASNGGVDAPGQLRAIWSDDYLRTNFAPTIDVPFRMPLDAQDRKMLVQLTAGFGEQMDNGKAYLPTPVDTERLMLSALGGLLDAGASWTERPAGVDVQQWRHLMSLGRDHYVRVVYAGYLLPFGHAVSFIKVTERKFESQNGRDVLNSRVAALRQRFFIVVREPIKQFDGSQHLGGGHPFPFTQVELLTTVTPKLVAPSDATCRADESGGRVYDASNYDGGLTPRQLFWPMMKPESGGDFRFDVRAVDRSGRSLTFSMPLLFMSAVGNTGTIKRNDVPSVGQFLINNIKRAYNAETARRLVDMGGDNVCYAPPDATSAGDTRLPTQSITFRAGSTVNANSTTRINTYPEVEEARVALLAAQRILGRDIAPVVVQYSAKYKAHGFGGTNAGEVFLEIKGAPFNMSFGGGAQNSRTDIVGAVASPTTAIKGMSRRIGLASDLAKVETNNFNPSDFFGDAKILGTIRLASIVPAVSDLSGPGAPKFVTREIPASGNSPAKSEARYEWQTTLSGMDDGLLLRNADGGPSPFTLHSVTTAVVGDPDSAETTTTATIGNFKVNLFGFVVLWFRELTFTSEKGRKPEVRIDLHPSRSVRFGGALEFVNELQAVIPGNGFSDPSALSVTPSGIEAKYSLTVPKVQVGVFDMSGLTFGARFTLPFDVRPMEVGFNFGERENPFSLTVSLLGGGGFVAIGIGSDGIREVEAAVEAGARCAIDLGVASGSVEIKAGVYFHWLAPSDTDGGTVQLTGYVRVHGELDVMGVISISITFNLSLNYEKRNHKSLIWGEASVTVEVEVLVFSGEVTVRCRREFIGSDADPKFAQLVPASTTWSSYCSAFAGA